MNKAQLVEELSSRFEGNRKQAQHALESVIDVIERALVKGEKVAITGFGSFEKIDRAARTARNPATGASVRVKKTSVPKFRAGTDLKAVVSGAKKLPKLAAATMGTTSSNGRRSGAKATAGTAAATTGRRGAANKNTATKATATKPAGRSPTKAAATKAGAGTKASVATAAKAANEATARRGRKAAGEEGAAAKTTARASGRRAAKKA